MGKARPPLRPKIPVQEPATRRPLFVYIFVYILIGLLGLLLLSLAFQPSR